MTHFERVRKRYEEEERKRIFRQRRSSFVFLMIAVVFVIFRLQIMPMMQSSNQPGAASNALPNANTGQKRAIPWNEILVNQKYLLPEGYQNQIELAPLTEDYQVDARTVELAKQMLIDAAADGVPLKVCSAYRSSEQQKELYEKEEQPSETLYAVQPPGASEHETGLAIDIVSFDHQTLDEAFEATAAFRWLSEHASQYGYILRYPKEKEEITGIIYEPWHYRYVGVETAEYMESQGICLEEYIQLG